MSLDKSAIEKIQESQLATVLFQQLGNLSPQVPAIAIPHEFKVETLEHLMDSPTRFRGVMSTHLINAFAEYANTQEAAKCFINAEDMSAVAYFDLGESENPGHGENRATIELQKTAAYRALLFINTKHSDWSQKELAEWCEDWRDQIEFINKDQATIPLIEALNAIRNITVEAHAESNHEERDFGSTSQAKSSVDVKGYNLPAAFKFTCQPYHGLDEFVFGVRIGFKTGESKPRLTTRIIKLEAMEEDMATDFSEKLTTAIDVEDKAIYLGNFSKI